MNQELEKQLGLQPLLHPLFNSIDDEGVFTPEEVAELIGRHPESVRKWCRDGKLDSYRFGGKYSILGSDLKRYMKNCKRQPSAIKGLLQ
ncbi:helix-turn-helix domain-containing protein [Bacillus sp. CMF21]|nr:helix-turn-helix domain-containing protein [Bacillus sp. CMF21]